MARAGVEGAVLNVLINLGSVKDEDFKASCHHKTEALGSEARTLCERVVETAKATFTS